MIAEKESSFGLADLSPLGRKAVYRRFYSALI